MKSLFKTYRVLYQDLRKQEQNLDNIILIYDFYEKHSYKDFNPIIMKDGSVIVIFKLSGMDYESLSEDDRKQLSYFIRMAFEKLGKGYTLTNYLVRRKAVFNKLKCSEAAPEIIKYIQERKNEYWKKISDNSLENDLIFCLRYYAQKKERTFSQLISESKLINLARKEVEDHIDKLNEGFSILKTSFNSININHEKFNFIGLDKEQSFQEIYKLLNLKMPGRYREDLSLNAQVCQSYIEFGKTHAIFNQENYVKAISVKYPPPGTIAFHLRRMFDLSFQYILCQSFGFVDYEQFEKKMLSNRNIAQSLSSFDKNAAIYVNEVSEFQNKVKTDKQMPVYWKFNIYPIAGSLDELNQNVYQIQTILKDVGSFGLVEKNNMRNSVISMFPGHSRLNARKAILLTANAGDLFCGYSLSKGDPDPVEFFMDRNNGVFGYHPFTPRENAHHLAICGPTGGGKSFLINRLIISALAENPYIFVIDISKSFNPLFEMLKTYSPSETAIMEISDQKIDFQFNPFIIENMDKGKIVSEEQLLFCEGLLKLMIGKLVNDSNRIYIRESLVQFFREYRISLKNLSSGETPPPPIDHLAEILKDITKDKNIYNSLRLWTEGRKSKLFNSGKDSLKRARYTLFDLEQLCQSASDVDELIAVIYTIFNKIYKDISSEKSKSEHKMIFLDEAHRYLLQPEFSYWINHLFRTGRHYNTLVGVITQSINDLITNDQWSSGIVTNLMQAFFLGGQKGIGEGLKKLGMTDYNIEVYEEMKKEKRELMYWSFSGLRRILNPLTDPHTYFLATTDPKERVQRKMLTEIFSGDIKKTINKMVELTSSCQSLNERQAKMSKYLKLNYPEVMLKYSLEE